MDFIGLINDKKVVGLDLDNTLYDQLEFEKQIFEIISLKFSRDLNIDAKLSFSLLLKLFEENKTKIFNRVLSALGYDDSKLDEYIVKEILPIYRNFKPLNLKLTNKGEKLLKLLKDKNKKLALITNGRVEQQRNKIEALGIEHLFDLILISGQYINAGKPSVVLFQKVLDFFKISSEEMIYIGDDYEADSSCEKLGIKFFNINEILFE